MHTSMHTYTHTYTHTCTHTCMDTSIHTYVHACIHACIHPFLFFLRRERIRAAMKAVVCRYLQDACWEFHHPLCSSLLRTNLQNALPLPIIMNTIRVANVQNTGVAPDQINHASVRRESPHVRQMRMRLRLSSQKGHVKESFLLPVCVPVILPCKKKSKPIARPDKHEHIKNNKEWIALHSKQGCLWIASYW